MNILRIYKIAKAILAIGKVLVPVIEELWGKDLNNDGIVGQKK